MDDKKGKKALGQQLSDIADALRTVIQKAKDRAGDCVLSLVRERGFSRFNKETQRLFRVVGVADYVAFTEGLSFEEISPMTVKKHVTGNNKASKEAVAAALEAYVGKQDYACDDESDAVAVGVGWLIEKGALVPTSS